MMQEAVASPGIEPGSGASETLILSIVLRGRGCKSNRWELFLPYFFKDLINVLFFT